MEWPSDLPIVDHHCHLAPSGEGVAAARRFRAAGGTHLFLATQNYAPTPPVTLEGYRQQFETTEAMARKIESEVGLRVHCVLAPYPVDILHQAEVLGTGPATELQHAALELAGQRVAEQAAVALGEVGWPHFPYPEPLRPAVAEVFDRALRIGRERGCPVLLHAQEFDAAAFRDLAGSAARASFPVHRLIKHYQRTRLPPDAYCGLVPSYLARRTLASEVFATPGPWFWETDFLDDPARPGAVLDLETVPRRARAFLDRFPDAAERLRVPFQDSVEKVYGFRPEPLERQEGVR
ncbi:MAG: TatD family hydrolase [Thermoplasmata archaeon]